MNQRHSKLRIAFDCEHARQSEAGIARYARELRDALSQRPDLDVFDVGGGSLLDRGTLRKKGVTAIQDLVWYPFAGRMRARDARADVYHLPSPRGPIRRGTPPSVLTIHDLASFRFPETLTRWTRLIERTALPFAARAADLIVAPSADTASDITRFLGVDASRIRVVPGGIAAKFHQREPMRSPFPFPYVLFVGTPQPRKNLPRLAEAVRILASHGSDLHLVVVGADGWGGVELLDERIHAVGRLSDDELVHLYRGASCLALVSLHEGFGFPALEGMAAGVPVVVSNAGSLPEITGGSAVIVDPFDANDIARGIEESVADGTQLVARGLAWVQQFTWEAAAERTAAIYRELV